MFEKTQIFKLLKAKDTPLEKVQQQAINEGIVINPTPIESNDKLDTHLAYIIQDVDDQGNNIIN